MTNSKRIDLSELKPGTQVRITDIEGHHTTLTITTQTEHESEDNLECVHVATDEPDFEMNVGILPTGRTVDRYIEVDGPYYIEYLKCEMIVWSFSIVE